MQLDLDTVNEKLRACQTPMTGLNIITPLARLSFPNLLTPQQNKKEPTRKPKYGTSLLIPAQFNIDMLKTAASKAAFDKWGSKAAEMRLKTPFLKAGEYKYEGYEDGWTLLRCSCLSKPTVLMKSPDGVIKITEANAEEIYPGRWCIASLNPFTYEEQGNKGVSFGLNNVVLQYNDDALGGRVRAEDEFEDIGNYEGGAAAATGTVADLF